MPEIEYKKIYALELKDGSKCRAELIHLNPQFHTKVKDPSELYVWRRENPKPGEKKYIQQKQVRRVICI